MYKRQLVAGPAQAGIQSPVSKPGIGLTAGAGAAPSAGAAGAAGESGFASLVALALDQLDGTSVGADGRTAGATCHAPRAEDDVEIGNAAASVDDDASVDGATLSVLIALATPIAAQVEAPAPEIVGQGSADLAAVDGDASGTAVTATVDAASPRAATTVPGTAARDFADALASATTTTSVGVAPVETTPVETTPATAIPTADTPAAP